MMLPVPQIKIEYFKKGKFSVTFLFPRNYDFKEELDMASKKLKSEDLQKQSNDDQLIAGNE